MFDGYKQGDILGIICIGCWQIVYNIGTGRMQIILKKICEWFIPYDVSIYFLRIVTYLIQVWIYRILINIHNGIRCLWNSYFDIGILHDFWDFKPTGITPASKILLYHSFMVEAMRHWYGITKFISHPFKNVCLLHWGLLQLK